MKTAEKVNFAVLMGKTILTAKLKRHLRQEEQRQQTQGKKLLQPSQQLQNQQYQQRLLKAAPTFQLLIQTQQQLLNPGLEREKLLTFFKYLSSNNSLS